MELLSSKLKRDTRQIKVSYSGTFTAKDPYKRIETLDAQSFREVMQAQYPEGTAQSADIQRILNVYPNQSTDWQDAIYQTGLSTDQNIGIAGKQDLCLSVSL